MKKQELPSIHNYNLDINLDELRSACDTLAEKFVDVRTANPMPVSYTHLTLPTKA